ncbi:MULTISPECIES: SAM-dependent methyltransferase [unclassified Streptomyces]|uniref:SAM-dependent methyltransferase n=1 Tax=unclassified Streptomyces TaxID=2593676 RepID=UPI002DD858B0|nr:MULTISPECIES: SAM-dependent methyltransferase [unclassified Streptomyces]WSA91045.1 SAM-dependent methyltransferase [Streptomyces sp. NBC_01795]WSB75370.1 SAM-dependent methyltransferase [Streptomyces sp. NBC_01775]WSS16348.1 SAM-dependent methyltransferase [Streptomyces sp. NBC_01186]WSS45165.1 SAM-dependent methyltransferase [Streptomyces sp. NBC_01187]
MTTRENLPGIDTTKPHSARMYDYYLGGKTHYEVDVQAAEAVIATVPYAGAMARANRDFMIRATRWLTAERGVRQFLDIGSGIPTEPNLHQVAQAVAPDARVVYTDSDPIVLQYAQALLHSTPEGRTTYLQADATRPETIMDSDELHTTLDLTRPVALSVNALFHFVPDESGPYELLRGLMERLAPGSFLCLSHATAQPDDLELAVLGKKVEEIYAKGGTTMRLRENAEIARFFDGLELVQPGLIMAHQWRPEPGMTCELKDGEPSMLAGVARKP